jgi:cyclase
MCNQAHSHSHDSGHSHDHHHEHSHPHGHAHSHGHDDHSHPEQLGMVRGEGARGSRRDFLQLLGGAMAGASVLELGFFRATVARAQSRTATKRVFDIEKVADGVYAALAHPAAITNCNAAIFVNSDHVVVVDAHSKPSAAASLITQIRQQVTTKPVRYLVNTHFHYDHTQGDPAYRSQGKIQIIASETTKRLMQQYGRDRLRESVEGVEPMLDTLRKRLAKSTSATDRAWCNDQIEQLQSYVAEMKSFTPEVPDITFEKTYVLNDRAQDLHLNFHGRAHTAGDIAVLSQQKKVVATGDMISGFLPAMGDGYPREWPATINSVGQLEANMIIAGHGPVQRNHERRIQLRNYIEELTGLVADGKKAGKPIAELQKTITVASLKTLQSNGYAKYVSDNLNNFAVYLGSRTAIEDRLAGNIDAIYKNLDKA